MAPKARSIFGPGFAVRGFALGVFAFGGLVGCYTVDFDETKPDVYYCKGDTDCSKQQSCQQFRCVADIGPQVEITLPEPLTPVGADEDVLIVDYNVSNFTLSDSSERVEGQGKLLISIDGGALSTIALTESGAAVDIADALDPGAHRVWVQAVYGDGETVYANPGATAYTVFYIVEQTLAGTNSTRPQIAIVSPGPQHTHVLGEDLEVAIAVRNFTLVDKGEICEIPPDCDPWDESSAPECAVCLENPEGHAHIYLIPNYPECLTEGVIGCNGEYIQSVRPSQSTSTDGITTTAIVSADSLPKTGTYTFTASLQHDDHLPFPSVEHVIFDQIEFTVVE